MLTMHIVLLIMLYVLSMISASSVNCCIMHGPLCIVWVDAFRSQSHTLKVRGFIHDIWICYISGYNMHILQRSSLSIFTDLVDLGFVFGIQIKPHHGMSGRKSKLSNPNLKSNVWKALVVCLLVHSYWFPWSIVWEIKWRWEKQSPWC